MISNTILSFVIWFYQNTFLRVLPTDLPFFPFSTYAGYLDTAKANLTNAFSSIGFIFPIDFLIIIIEAIIAAELLLFVVKIAMYVINIFRGAGA